MSDSEEDYMKMTFPTSPTTTSKSTSTPPETSLQRRARLRREAEARSRPKSKSELLAEADRRREAAHATSLLNDPSTSAPSKSKGLAMMAKMGFTGGALGASTTPTAATEPIRVDIKDGREGIGLESERKRKLREAAEAAGEQVKKARVGEEEYRERVRREREVARLERQVGAAQKVAEGMEGEVKGGTTLKGVPVEYRGLVRKREEAERERRMRYDLEQAVMRSSKGLPGYDDGEEDEDDRRALGKGKAAATTYVVAEDLDEEDEELEAFEALEPEERLRRVVEYLRREHRYCFWCKCAYPDEEMDGCPGLTEEDHD